MFLCRGILLCFCYPLSGATSFDPIGLPCFKRILDSFPFYPSGTSIRAGD